jgi:pyruvate kinase
MRHRLRDWHARIPIIAKIENRSGTVQEAIVAAAHGITLARGNLGVELPMTNVPSMQKNNIRMTVSKGKLIIMANQMPASIEKNLRPSRAETSDAANAIFDGSSAIMQSDKSALGNYPLEKSNLYLTFCFYLDFFTKENRP